MYLLSATCSICYFCEYDSHNNKTLPCDVFNKSVISVVNCGLSDNNNDLGCMDVKYKDGKFIETISITKKKQYIFFILETNRITRLRGCALYRYNSTTTLSTCSQIESLQEEYKATLISCTTCNSDLCNSASIRGTVFWDLLLIFVVYKGFSKLLLNFC